jgi:hypothetical protein
VASAVSTFICGPDNRIITESSLKEHGACSLLDCCNCCVMTDNCRALSYRHSDHECRLSEKVSGDLEITFDDGTQIFYKSLSKVSYQFKRDSDAWS